MDQLSKTLREELNNEEIVQSTLRQFNQQNATNFEITNDAKLPVCKTLLEAIDPNTSTDTKWSPLTVSQCLICLRILCRGKVTLPLLCEHKTISLFVQLADIGGQKDGQQTLGERLHDEQFVKVIVEAVKCLCNIYLINKHLVSGCVDMGVVHGLSRRLACHKTLVLSYDLVYFDLRLLFLLTACDSQIRALLRDDLDGLNLMNSLLSATLFNAHGIPSSAALEEVPVAKSGDVLVLSKRLTDNDMNILCEILKISFNQTAHWDNDYVLRKEELESFSKLLFALRTLLVSLPSQASELSLKTISHVAEVLVICPSEVSGNLILPAGSTVTESMAALYPDLYAPNCSDTTKIVEGGVASGLGMIYTLALDHEYEGFNMAPIIGLLNYLHLRLCQADWHISLPPVLTALKRLCKANRIIRRFTKSQILPPLGKVTDRPEVGESFRNKLVRLMTAAGGHGVENMVADFIFVLCKENTSRLVKYTGYGNAAGLLMSRGLLGGNTSSGAADYSSDDETSDTEEYIESQPKIDDMTGGLVRNEPSPLDSMTDEEKEQEAIKLNALIEQLNRKGIIKMMPLTEKGDSSKRHDDSDSDVD